MASMKVADVVSSKTDNDSVPQYRPPSLSLDQPDKYLQLLHAKLRAIKNSTSTVPPAVTRPTTVQQPKRKQQRISVTQFFQRQFSTAFYSPRDFDIGTLLTAEQLTVLWTFLPPRYQIGTPKILFNSSVDGVSIRTLLRRIEDAPGTLIAIHTTTGDVFGAFCSAPWSARLEQTKERRFFGNGESFLFTCLPRSAIYPWVGLTGVTRLAVTESGDSPQLPPAYFQAAEVGSTSSLSIGGGNGAAICFPSDLSRGSSTTCTTFNNPPLCTTGDFTTLKMEVYGIFL